MYGRIWSLVLVFTVALLGASVPPITKIALQTFTPSQALFGRVFISTIALTILFAVMRIPFRLEYYRRTWVFSFLLAGNFTCMLLALDKIPLSLMPVIYATIPLIVVIIQKIRGDLTDLNTIKIIGILIGFFGVVIAMTSRGVGVVSMTVLVGVAIVLVGSVCFSFFTILSKHYQQTMHPLHLIYSSTLTASIVSAPIAIYEGFSHASLTPIPLLHLTALVSTALIGTVLFYSSHQYALKHSDPVTASLFTYIQPLIGVILAVVMIGESINILFVIGATLTLFGAYLTRR